jgi:hypothetical protein
MFDIDVFSRYFKYIPEYEKQYIFDDLVIDALKADTPYKECIRVFNSIMDSTATITSNDSTKIENKMICGILQLFPQLKPDIPRILSYSSYWLNEKFYIYLFDNYYQHINDMNNALSSFTAWKKKRTFLKLVEIIRSKGDSKRLVECYRHILKCVIPSDDYDDEFVGELCSVLPHNEVKNRLLKESWFKDVEISPVNC